MTAIPRVVNELLDPSRRPDPGYLALVCDLCGGFVSWAWAPAPPVPLVHPVCPATPIPVPTLPGSPS